MKIYTEFEVRLMLNQLPFITQDNINKMCNSLTPIKIPTDDELYDQATKAMEKYYGTDNCEHEIDSYYRGVQWMKQQIQGGNK